LTVGGANLGDGMGPWDRDRIGIDPPLEEASALLVPNPHLLGEIIGHGAIRRGCLGHGSPHYGIARTEPILGVELESESPCWSRTAGAAQSVVGQPDRTARALRMR